MFIQVIDDYSIRRYNLFQALLDATYVVECRLVNEDFPQDRSEKEIKHIIGNMSGYLYLFPARGINVGVKKNCRVYGYFLEEHISSVPNV